MRNLIILLLIAGGGWFGWKEWRMNAELAAKNARLKANLDADEGRLNTEARAEKEVIADLKRQRAFEQSEIDRLKNDLHSRESLGFDHGFLNHEQDERKKRQEEIQSLEAGLAQVRAQEADLQNGGKQAHALSQANEKARQAQFDQAIRDLSAKIQNEKAQINQLRKQKFDQDAQDRANAMQTDLATDQDQLNAYKSERATNGPAFGADRAQMDSQNRDALVQARQAENSIKAQINEEKAAIQHLNQAVGSESKGERDAQAAQSQLRAAIAGHEDKAKDLDARIRTESDKLAAIVGK